MKNEKYFDLSGADADQAFEKMGINWEEREKWVSMNLKDFGDEDFDFDEEELRIDEDIDIDDLDIIEEPGFDDF